MGVVGIQELGDADVVFADDAADAGERQLQFVGRGCDWEKDAGLDGARVHRFERERERDGGRRGRMRFEIHLQKLQQRFAFAHGDGEAQGADVLGAIFEFQADGHFVGRHGVRKQARALIVEQARDQKQQRLEQADRMIQLDAIFIRGFRLEDFERPMDGAASQLLQVNAVRAEAFGEAGFGQLGQLLEGVDAPAFQDLRHFFGERERRDIEIVEIWARRVTPGKLRAARMAASAVSAMAILTSSPARWAMAWAIWCGEPWSRRSPSMRKTTVSGAVCSNEGEKAAAI